MSAAIFNTIRVDRTGFIKGDRMKRSVPSIFNKDRRDPCMKCDISDICSIKVCGKKSIHRYLEPEHYSDLKIDFCLTVLEKISIVAFMGSLITTCLCE